MSYSGLQGQSGDIPYELFLKKIETSCVYEDPNQVDDNLRQLLVDNTPDKPLFESDQPRRDNQSRNVINLRTSGARVSTEPYLPDGSFTDWHALEKDPRGTATGPDMKKYDAQRYARGKYVKFYDDADYSVPESGINISKMNKDIKWGQHQVKERLKIFDTALDSWHNGGTASVPTTKNGLYLQTQDGLVHDLADSGLQQQRIGKGDKLMDNYKVGWRRTVDQKFKVSGYNTQRSLSAFKDQSWSKNRQSSYIDHDTRTEWQDSNINKSLVVLMKDLLAMRSNNQESFLSLIPQLGKSKKSQNLRHRKIKLSDLSAKELRPTNTTASAPSNLLHNNSIISRTGSRLIQKLDPKYGKVSVNPVIIEFMSSVNHKIAPRKQKDLRNNIKQSATESGIFVMEKSSKNAKNKSIHDTNLLQNREAIDTHEKFESKKVHQYTTKQLNTDQLHDMTNFEKYKHKSAQIGQHRGLLDKKVAVVANNTEGDIRFRTNDTKNSFKAPMGTKYTTRYINKDHSTNSINDL